MNARVEIKKKTKTIVSGRAIEDLEDYYKCWCTPKELYGKELYEAINTKLESVLTFEVRYCEKIKAMRKEAKKFVVIFDEQQFEVYHVDFKANSKDKVIIKANGIT